jgi:CheY-like chemotaxis protein
MGESHAVGRAEGAKSRPRVLVVDDEPALREIASELLAGAGYEVVTAADGIDALRLLAEPLPDVVITDVRMPRMSGWELLAVVRQRFPQLPVIAVSADVGSEEFPPGMQADALLSKGAYSTDDLCAKITELLSPRRSRTGSAEKQGQYLSGE